MKKIVKVEILIWLVVGLFMLMASCNKKNEASKGLAYNLEAEVSAKKPTAKELSQTFKDYWYAGKAEITSYKLEQARYGEIRNGKAVLIYVTEDFLPNKQVKAEVCKTPFL